MDTKEHRQFVAVQLEGAWVVLSPWIKTEDGYTYRQHVGRFEEFNSGSERDAREAAAKFLARQLNLVCGL